MADWMTVEEGREAEGLRLVLTSGVPGPWGEAAKAVFHVKGLDCPRIPQFGGQANPELVDWTGENNAPQAILGDERARTHWSEIIALGEQLAADPPLIPEHPDDRVLMFGLLNELAGEGGFGWQRRLMLFAPFMALPPDHPGRRSMASMCERYGFSEESAEAAPSRVAEILTLLGDQWQRQSARGRKFLVGERLSALDLYWSAFAALIDPLPHALCPMPEMMRAGYSQEHPRMQEALNPELMEHRQRIYEDWLELPIDLGPGFQA
ncbi:MAG: hypothetical protein OSB70_14385 [Myxococcota bacterium]|nr:hypothetical protein [Myxococcota bacterium]